MTTDTEDLVAGADDTFGADSSLAAAVAPVSLEEAADLVRREYGVAATLRRLIGEKDQNYAVAAGDGREFVLKLIHPGEDPAVTNFQTAVLLQVEAADPSLPVQRVVRCLDGAVEKAIDLADGTRRMMRMTTFLPGAILRGQPFSLARCRALGEVLARIQLSLAGFGHPADRHVIAWDIQHTAQQAGVLPEIAPAHHRELMEAGLARFAGRAAPAMAGLRHQVVHNDLSGDNVVVDPADPDRIAGVLDFGDAARTAVVNDVAIAMAYNLVSGADPMRAARAVAAGFHAVKPLLPEEIDLLLDLVIARLVVRVGITEWRARRFPENRDYILRTTPVTWLQLEALLALPQHETTRALHEACPAR